MLTQKAKEAGALALYCSGDSSVFRTTRIFVLQTNEISDHIIIQHALTNRRDFQNRRCVERLSDEELSERKMCRLVLIE